MNEGKPVFAQVMQHLPLTTFRRCVARYRETSRDIEACLPAQVTKCDHMGPRGNIATNTLANANTVRNWRVYCVFRT